MSGALPPAQGSLEFGEEPTEQLSHIARDKPEPEPRRAKLVTRLCDEVRQARAYHATDFKRMKSSTEFVLGAQWDTNQPLTGNGQKDHRYVANSPFVMCNKPRPNSTPRTPRSNSASARS